MEANSAPLPNQLYREIGNAIAGYFLQFACNIFFSVRFILRIPPQLVFVKHQMHERYGLHLTLTVRVRSRLAREQTVHTLYSDLLSI